MVEHVILVNEQNEAIGTRAKATVHQQTTPLHRGFSLFLFDVRGRLLLQQRSDVKQTWPLVWSNSCCGHPQSGEQLSEAIRRRLQQELGIGSADIYEVLPDYRYQASYAGTMENEFCPVWVGWTDEEPAINEQEVAATRWVAWREFIAAILDPDDHTYDDFSPWCLEEAKLLNAAEFFHDLWDQHVVASGT